MIRNRFYIAKKTNGVVGEYHEVIPHYKTLSKKYKRESNQMFFRETLDGAIKLFGKDFDLVNSYNINDTLVFDVYRNGVLLATNEFNKTDCKFDRVRKSVELKLAPHDKYTDILSKYKNTYDLVKCAPATSWLTLTKRCIVQIYLKGEKVISNYSGGTYWETDVNNTVDDEDELIKKYYFGRGPSFTEVNLTGFNYNINASYKCLYNNDCWNAESEVVIDGQVYKIPCSIKFTKVYDAQTAVNTDDTVKLLSDGVSPGTINVPENNVNITLFDTYRIEIYTDRDGTGSKLYQSKFLYGVNNSFSLKAGSNLYAMERVPQPLPQKDPTPNEFNLGNYVIGYSTWVRELCDVDKVGDVETYDLPYDDFATERNNYKKCIGLKGLEGEDSVIRIVQQEATSDTPTAYGQNDFGKYFTSPWAPSSGRHGYYPLSRSVWGNTSLWVFLDGSTDGSFEQWCSKTYKKYTLKDSYHIADVIKALLYKIDPTITHEATAEYSEFLYGDSSVASSSALGGNQIYITQKTNILKGEYDQAAQKAEITLEQVMSMLRDCFRCYWFIDKNNRFRIEHIFYFTHGQSYSYYGNVGIDLTTRFDKFNKKPALYCQQELEYQKSDLKSRFEFGWMDDVTDAMGNIAINFDDTYIPKDSTEDISVGQFCPDIDYMLFRPDDFSNDGFALLMAKNGEVEIISRTIYDPKQFGAPVNLYTQNGMLSWRQLISHRMLDAPGYRLSLDEYEGPASAWYVQNIERSMRHDIEMQIPYDELAEEYGGSDIVNKLIKTDIGNGCIEDMSVNVNTDKMKITLSYEPV